MESEAGNLEEILKKIEILRKFTDTSKIDRFISRLQKTTDLEMQIFFLSKIYDEFDKLQTIFPDVDENFPLVKEINGSISIGDLVYNQRVIGRFSLSKEDLNRNILIIGSTGHGKTSLIYNIIKKAANENIKYLIFDMKKDYIPLSLDKDTLYIGGEEIRINPLEAPKGINEKEWAVHFADIFSDSFALLIGSRDYLLEQVIALFSSWNYDYPPSLYDLLQWIETKGRKNDYYKVIEGRLKSLVSSSSLFDCNNGISFEKLGEKNIVIGLDNIGLAEQYFLVSYILSWFYYLSLAKNNREFKRLIVIDDAHSVLDSNKEKDYAKGIPVLHSIIAKIREFGYGFIFSDQQISSILSSALQNTNTKFLGKVNLYSDLSRISPSESYKLGENISRLNKGEFIVFNESLRPFCLLKVDNIEINKEMNIAVFQLKKKMDRDFLRFFKAESTSFTEIAFLKEVGSNPWFNLSLHQENLSKAMDKEEFNGIKARLLNDKVISEVSLQLQAERTSKFLFINRNINPEISKMIKELKTFDEDSFFKYLFKYLVGSYLKNKNIKYDEDDNGFLIKGLVKMYIFVGHEISSLIRILETSFDRVIFVAKDSVDEDSVFAELIRKGNTNSILNMKSLKVVHFKDFRLN